VTTFQFDTLIETAETPIEILSAFGDSTTTQVFGDEPVEDVTGTLGSTTVTITMAEWGVLAAEAPGSACGVQPGDVVTVFLTVSDLIEPINGVQALLAYDQDVLTFVGIALGDGSGSPWDSATYVYGDVADGLITYALVLLSSESDADAVVARFEFLFQPDQTPAVTGVQLVPEEAPLLTKFTSAATGATVIPELAMAVAIASIGDMDTDGDIDLEDYDGFASCMGGPGVPYPGGEEECCRVDFDRDDDVDLFDFGEFQKVFGGP